MDINLLFLFPSNRGEIEYVFFLKNASEHVTTQTTEFWNFGCPIAPVFPSFLGPFVVLSLSFHSRWRIYIAVIYRRSRKMGLATLAV